MGHEHQTIQSLKFHSMDDTNEQATNFRNFNLTSNYIGVDGKEETYYSVYNSKILRHGFFRHCEMLTNDHMRVITEKYYFKYPSSSSVIELPSIVKNASVESLSSITSDGF